MRHALLTVLALGLAAGPGAPPAQGQAPAEQPPAAAPMPGHDTSAPTQIVSEAPWVLDCPEPADAEAGRCQLTQRIVPQDGDGPSIRLVVGYPPQGPDPVMRIYVPTGVLIQPGLRLEIGAASPTSIPLLVCTRDHCVSETRMSAPLVEAMRTAEAGSLTMLVLPDAHELQAGFTLQGFGEGFEALGRDGGEPVTEGMGAGAPGQDE